MQAHYQGKKYAMKNCFNFWWDYNLIKSRNVTYWDTLDVSDFFCLLSAFWNFLNLAMLITSTSYSQVQIISEPVCACTCVCVCVRACMHVCVCVSQRHGHTQFSFLTFLGHSAFGTIKGLLVFSAHFTSSSPHFLFSVFSLCHLFSRQRQAERLGGGNRCHPHTHTHTFLRHHSEMFCRGFTSIDFLIQQIR